MVEKKTFNGKILIIGYGGVASTFFPLLLEHVDAPIENITIIDKGDKEREVERTRTGVRVKRMEIDNDNLETILDEFIGENGMLLDLSYNIGTVDMIKWCHDHNTLYANTSIERWNPLLETDPRKKTLYDRHMELMGVISPWSVNSKTALLDHGANPGLISHFAKRGLVDIATRYLAPGAVNDELRKKLQKYLDAKDYPRLAQALEVKVVHCSERDSQVTRVIRKRGEMVNTWSPDGFLEEGMAPAEMGWGTHEKNLPQNAIEYLEGPKNQIALAQMGINTWLRSYVPGFGEIRGMVIRHGEAFGISDRWTVRDEKGDVVWRPTVLYVYRPSDETILSLDEFRTNGYKYPSRKRVMRNEIVSGRDNLGALLMGGFWNAHWTGTILDIKPAKKLAPGQNATLLQVAAGYLAGVLWMIAHPNEGVRLPDDLPYEPILETATPFLGEIRSRQYGWNPSKNRRVYFTENPAHRLTKDIWQFENFLPLP